MGLQASLVCVCLGDTLYQPSWLKATGSRQSQALAKKARIALLGVGQESDGKVPPHPQGLLRAGRPPFPTSQLCSSGPLSAHEVGTLVWLPRLPCLSLFWVALPWSVFVSIHQLNYNFLKGTLTSTPHHAVGRRKLCLWIE